MVFGNHSDNIFSPFCILFVIIGQVKVWMSKSHKST